MRACYVFLLTSHASYVIMAHNNGTGRCNMRCDRVDMIKHWAMLEWADKRVSAGRIFLGVILGVFCYIVALIAIVGYCS